MGRERRFSRRPVDHGITNNSIPAPSSGGKGQRSAQRQHTTRPLDNPMGELHALSDGGDFEITSRRNGNSQGSQKKRKVKLNRYTVLSYAIVAALISVALFNYFIAHSTLNIKYGQSNWLPTKMASSQHKAVPTDENARHFLRTGQLPGAKQRLAGSVKGLRKDGISFKRREMPQETEGLRPYGAKFMDGNKEWPPLSSLMDETGNIADDANISGLLDFSIIGFPKTGTTTILRHLSNHLANLLPKEHCDLVVNDTAKLVRDLYEDHDQRVKKSSAAIENRLVGIKCPQDISSDWSMHNYARYFPRTKLVVGLRHPIFWFESLYNFRVSNVPWKKMPHTSQLTKGCASGSQGVCAWRANFHDFLARLGKTPLSSPSELKLLSLSINPVQSKVGPVFLYDLSQLSEVKFRKDLKNFLGLTKDIPPFPAIDTSGRFDHLMAIKGHTANEKIDICDPEHHAIRSALMKKATSASIWIKEYFLESKDVFVSNRPYFEAVLKSWKFDPCG